MNASRETAVVGQFKQPQRPYAITPELRNGLSAVFILDTMINVDPKITYPAALDESPSQRLLKPLLDWMVSKELLTFRTQNGVQYFVPAQKGLALLRGFWDRYSEFRDLYYVFNYVDLEKHEFAFAQSLDLSDEDWEALKTDPEHDWEDLRVAVAEAKGINPVEIVFMSFMYDDRFDLDDPDWPRAFVDGAMWREVADICNTDLAWTQLDESVAGATSAMQQIIAMGTEVVLNLKRRRDADEAERAAQDNAKEKTVVETVEETVVEEEIVTCYPVAHYDAYYDPFYVSPIWLTPLFVL